jgi:outer membrane lipase/esterase
MKAHVRSLMWCLTAGLLLATPAAPLRPVGAPASAQGLNDVLAGILSNQCAVLAGRTLGPDLNNLCTAVPAVAGSSAGGTSTLVDRVSQFDEERRLHRRLRDRRQGAAADSVLGSGFSLFVSSEYQNMDKDTTQFETGFRQDTAGVTIGGDYAFGTAAVLGLAVTYAHEFGDYAGAGGGYDHDKYGALIYGNVTPLPNLFIDGTVGYRYADYSYERKVSLQMAPAITTAGRTEANSHGYEFRAGVNSGYDFVIDRFTVGPRLGVNYRYSEISGFAESGRTGLELAYDRQNAESLTTVAGIFGSMAISTGLGVFVPQLTGEYIHEFLNDQRRYSFRLVQDGSGGKFQFETDRPDRDYFTVGGGVVLVLPNGISPFINYRELLGYRDRHSHTVTAGVRFTF